MDIGNLGFGIGYGVFGNWILGIWVWELDIGNFPPGTCSGGAQSLACGTWGRAWWPEGTAGLDDLRGLSPPNQSHNYPTLHPIPGPQTPPGTCGCNPSWRAARARPPSCSAPWTATPPPSSPCSEGDTRWPPAPPGEVTPPGRASGCPLLPTRCAWNSGKPPRKMRVNTSARHGATSVSPARPSRSACRVRRGTTGDTPRGVLKGAGAHPGCESGAGGSKGKNAAKSSRLPAATKVLVRPSAEVAEGTQVTLTCQAPRAPPGTVYAWFKNGRWVTEGPEPSLELRGHRSDAGLYGCRAGRGPRAAPAALSVLCELGGRHLRGEGTGRGHRDAPPPRGRGCPVCVATSRWR